MLSAAFLVFVHIVWGLVIWGSEDQKQFKWFVGSSLFNIWIFILFKDYLI